jgi:uncharacterized phage infection (PIP) family protein YhgE
MKTPTIVIGVLTLISASLATSVVTTVIRNRELVARLEQAQPAPGPAVPATETGRLRQALEDQELANAALRDELDQLKRGATNSPPRSLEAVRASNIDSSQNAPRQTGSAWLDRLKKEDPERYKQIVAEREQRRKATDQWFADTINQLDQRAQSAPTEQEATLASQIADTLAKLNELRQQWAAIRELPEANQSPQGQQLIAQMQETTQALRDLSQQDRTLQLQQFAQSIGLSDQASLQGFVNSISTIYSNTSYRAMTGGGGFGGRGGPPSNTGTTTPTPPANTTSTPTPRP